MLKVLNDFGYIYSNVAINKDLKARKFCEVITTDSDYKILLKVKYDIDVTLLSEVYLDEKRAEQEYYKDNKITFISNGTLGNTVYDTTT